MNKRYEEGRKPFFSESGETQRKQYVWAKDKEGKEYLQETESLVFAVWTNRSASIDFWKRYC